MKGSKILLIFAVAFVFAFSYHGAEASGTELITNGDFETGDFSGWTLFTTPIGTTSGPFGNPTVTQFDTDGDGDASFSARFNVGRIGTTTVPEGGGVLQSITTAGGDLTITADISSAAQSSGNASCSIATLWFDGVIVDTHDFGDCRDFVERAQLEAIIPGVAAGTYEVKIQFARIFTTSTNTPLEHLDNVKVNGSAGEEPDPPRELTACEMYAGMGREGNDDPQNGSLAVVDLVHGTLHEVGPAANEVGDLFERQFGLSGIAFNSDNRLFGSIVRVTEGGSALVEIDPATGKLKLDLESIESQNDLPIIFEKDTENRLRIVDLAFHPETDVLYGIARGEGDALVTIDTTTAEASFVGVLMLDEDNLIAGGLSFLPDGTMIVTGESFGSQDDMNVIALYSSFVPDEDDNLFADDWATLEKFYDGLGVSCDAKIYATTGMERDSVHLITLTNNDGLEAAEELAAGAGTNPSDVDFFPPEPEPVQQDNNGGDNQWDTRPTFGISHETRQDQIVENGFRFNSEHFTLTDNHHTDFAEQSVDIGTINSFSATVYASNVLKVQEFLFGIPNVGEAHLAELGVEVWYDRDGNIEDVIVVQQSDVIDADTVSVSHEMTQCLSTDADALCDTTTVSMTFLEPLADKVMAVKAIDYALRDQRTFLNEGFDISGESLNPMLSSMIPSNVKNQGLLQITQMAKYSPYWTSENGRMFEMNSFGSFKEINQTFERFQDTGDARNRLHSGFGGIIAYEQNKALEVFDSSNYISELPESFAYIYPETGQRITDEMMQGMLLQEEIAQRILDEMDRQDRHY